jgi:hypothetical protein
MGCGIGRAKTKLVVRKKVVVTQKLVESSQNNSLKQFADRTKETNRTEVRVILVGLWNAMS